MAIPFVMDLIEQQVLEELKLDFQEHGKLTTEILSKLLFVFDSCLTQALDVLDHCEVLHITSPSGRSLYQVQGKRNARYICYKYSNYCSCPAYKFSVLKKGNRMCKHKLAVLLSCAMGLCKDVEYTDETVALMLAGIC